MICQNKAVIIIHFNNNPETWQSAARNVICYNRGLRGAAFWDKCSFDNDSFMADGLCNQICLCYWLKQSSLFQCDLQSG